MKLDLLVFASHPDDAELGCSGTILSFTSNGKKAGIIDLTRGELGTRGTVNDRKEEAAASASILNLSIRENLELRDGFIRSEEESILKLVQSIRSYRPEIVLANAVSDRHPDHGDGGDIASRACFLAGLAKVDTIDKTGENQLPWRPKLVYHYIQDRLITPDVIVDITPFWEGKIESIKAFRSQFFNPESKEPETYISNSDYWQFVEARAREFGHAIGVTFGEGFTTDRNRRIGVKNLENLI